MKIISGGQTGADRAGLDVALALGLSHGGWCPRGRRSEKGLIPHLYELKETESANYPPRTEKNIEESDGTLIFTWGILTPGTRLTIGLCDKHDKPFRRFDLVDNDDKDDEEVSSIITNWLIDNEIEVLNVAGTRESKAPGIHSKVYCILVDAVEAYVDNAGED